MKSNVTQIFKFKPIKLQFLRERYGCSLRELAQKINYSTTTISKWEKGKSVPSNEIVAKLATIFNVHDNFFFSTGVIPNFSGTVFFRKGAVLPKRNEIEAKSQARLFAMVDQKITLDYGLRGYESYGIEEKNTQFQVLDKEEIKNQNGKTKCINAIHDLTLLPKSFLEVVLSCSEKKVAELSKKDIQEIMENITSLKLNVKLDKLNLATVTKGGVDSSQIDKTTFKSKLVDNLYIIGECTDVDGECGGYNLTYAFSSAYCAYLSISNRQI